MPQNFIACDREQELLLPPSLREWLPEGHLAWFVIDAVAQLDLAAFRVAYRADGHGRAAHDPAMMVALLLYCYAVGERSSRRIERRCVEDVAVRVICANQVPDHTTIARFRQRHETALAELFGEVLALCAGSGLVRVGVIAVDGTSLRYVNYRDRKKVASALRPIYTAPNADAALDELNAFEREWGERYPPTVAAWRTSWEHVIPFLALPGELRRAVYTTNTIEGLHRQVRKAIKTRGHFPDEQAATKLIYLAVIKADAKWQKNRAWTAARAGLKIHFGDRFPG